MALQFFAQQKDYWCGPACAQMLLGVGEQAALARQLKTNPRTGTTREAIVKLIRTSGQKISVHPRGSIVKLSHHLPALVNYQEIEGEDHYAIALRITQKHVLLHDPWHGPNYRLSIATFNRRWRNPKLRKKYTGWFVAFR